MGGWLEIVGLKLISTQVIVEVEVGVALGKINIKHTKETIRTPFLSNQWDLMVSCGTVTKI